MLRVRKRRHLTDDEIDDILDFITLNSDIPLATAVSIANRNREKLRSQLVTQLVYPEIIPSLKKKLREMYESSLIQPGESVGIICAQSIGEKNTQSTLNTFHFTGQSEKTVLAGVPRFQELLNAAKEPKTSSCKVYFDSSKSEEVATLRALIGPHLVGLRFKQLVSRIEIDTTENVDEEDEEWKPPTEPEWYSIFDALYSEEIWYRDRKSFSSYSRIKAILNLDTLYRFKVDLNRVANVFNSSYEDLCVVFSPTSVGRFDILVRTSDISLPKNVAKAEFVTPENCVHIYLEECVVPTVESTLVSGIEGIESMYFTHNDGGSAKKRWFVETEGSNYVEVMGLPFVDCTLTQSNNIWEIYSVLGIEATRSYLIEEFSHIMEGVNKCHILLLAERMTFSGSIASISRYTMRKDESGPMSRASFEESVDNFLKAAFTCEMEDANGVSASIICGKRARIGTAMMDLKIDVANLPPPK
jgi:DNA-directed RNA polymerase beta' subunit